MAKIRHIALISHDPSMLAEFYKSSFGLQEVGRLERDGTVYLSDGYINLAILPGSKGPDGIDHFGFQVDDIDGTVSAALASGAQESWPLPPDGRMADAKVRDAVGQRVDISQKGWKI